MAQRFFYCISIVFHPVFLTTIGMILLTLWLLPGIPFKSSFMLAVICAAYSIAIPLSFIVIARLSGFIHSYQLKRRNERIMSLVITAVSIYFFHRVLVAWHVSPTIRHFVVGVIVLMLIAAALCFISRISLHTIAWGGLTALISYISFYKTELSVVLAVAVLLSGLVGTARLYLNEHKPIQIYSGYMVGFVTIWLTLIILSL